jgi:23S rRNA pseudouridine1911/1915/1917 synthase
MPTSPKTIAPRAALAEGVFAFVVGEGDGGERLDRFLSRAAEARGLALSRTRLKSLIEAGNATIDGVAISDPAARVAEGATIAVVVPAATEAAIVGEDLALDVVFEDAHLLIVDKPAGLVVHPAPGHSSGTLVNALIRHCGDSLSGIGGVKRPGVVHRLDKDTSGLLVVAKTDAAHQGLAALFADHGRSGSLTREYRALIWGALDAKAGVIDAPLGRHPRHREKMAVVAAGRGREAVTHWRVIETLEPASLVACQLETGRTHQIRVHLAHIGHPLLGDPVYGAGFKTKASHLSAEAQAALAALGRQALHAAVLGFEHPITGEPLRFESAPPADFAKLVAALRQSLGGERTRR